MSRTVKALTLIPAGILTLLLAVPWLVPVAAFIPSVEAGFSAALGQPVKIAGLRLSLLPLQITASQVSSPLFQIAHVTARPTWQHLLSEVHEIDEIELEGVRVRSGLLRALSNRPAPSAEARLRVRRVVLKDVDIHFDTATLRSLQGVVMLSNTGRVQEVRVEHQ